MPWLRNKRTGETVFVEDTPTRGTPIGLQDPARDLERPQAVAELRGRDISNRVDAATIDARIAKAVADAKVADRAGKTEGLPEGLMWSEDGTAAVPIPGYRQKSLTPDVRKGAIDAYNDAVAIDGIVSDLRSQFESGPGATDPWSISALRDYLPTDANRVFNDTGQRARGYVKRALGFTGGEGNTVAESSALYDPYLPKASDNDAQIESKIRALQTLGQQARQKAVNVLGGTPDASGNIVPMQDGRRPTTPWEQTYISNAAPSVAPAGSGTQQLPMPPEYQQAHSAWLAQNMRDGRIDPDAYAAMRTQLDQQFGLTPDPEAYRKWAAGIGPGMTIGPVPGPTVPLSGVGKARNDLVSNPVGAAGAGFLDAATMGAVSALLGQDAGALNAAHPLASTLGQIGGSVAGTGLVGALGRRAATRLAPRLLGGGARAQLGRDLATDAIYSGAYGYNQGNDPLLSAATGVAGSAIGRGIGNATGKAISGLDLPVAVRTLRNKGMRNFTVGQSVGGGAKAIEDAMSSIPVIGDVVNTRRLEGFRDFNRAAFNDPSFAKVGAQARNIGEEGVGELIEQIGNAYDNATAGVSAPLDAQFLADMAAVRARRASMPDDLAKRFDLALNNRVGPIEAAGNITGENYQQAFRGLKSYRNETTKPGFEDDYRGALTGAMDALTGQVERAGGGDVVAGLRNADAAYRNAKTLERAVQAARKGGTTGEVQTFSPSQLVDAGWASKKKYGGQRPFAELADAGQEVLPSRLPDSGTARRAAQIALPTALVGSGAGIDYANGDGIGAGTATGLALAAGLGLGGTKAGQKVLNDAIFVRPDAVRNAGLRLSRLRRMIGAGAIPLALPLAGGQ